MENLGMMLRKKLRERGIECPDPDETLTPEQWLMKKARWENEAVGKLKGIDCPKCKNKGYIVKVEDGEIVQYECECMAKRRSLKRIERSGLKPLLERYTFANYRTDTPWRKNAKELALKYLHDHRGKWFLACGVPGSGKTHICTALCGGLMNAGMETRYMMWRDDSVRLKACIKDSEEYSRRLQALKDVPALYIDDFFKSGRDWEGKPNITPADVNLAFDLLNDRYNDPDKVTIISTELLTEQLMTVDMAVGSRIYERAGEYCLELSGDEKNYRIYR